MVYTDEKGTTKPVKYVVLKTSNNIIRGAMCVAGKFGVYAFEPISTSENQNHVMGKVVKFFGGHNEVMKINARYVFDSPREAHLHMINRFKFSLTSRKSRPFKLPQKYLDEGFTTRANINTDFILSLKVLNEESAKVINNAIKTNDVKTAVEEMRNAACRHRTLRECSEKHDKLICDANGVPAYIWEHESGIAYKLD